MLASKANCATFCSEPANAATVDTHRDDGKRWDIPSARASREQGVVDGSERMADEYGYDDEEQQEKASTLRQKLADAENRAKAAEALASENQILKQQIAVSSAGLTLSDVQRNALLAVHTGDLTPDGLKSTAQALGFMPAPAPVPDDPSLAVHAQIAAAAAGAEAPPANRDAEIDAQINAAKTQEELMAVYASSGRPIAQ